MQCLQLANQSSLDSSCFTTNKGNQLVSQPSQPLGIKDVSVVSSQPKGETTDVTGWQGANTNPYARLTGDKCYKCGETRQRSHLYPKQATVNLVEWVDEETEVKEKDEVGDESADPLPPMRSRMMKRVSS